MSCAHGSRFFFRQRVRVVAKRPVAPVVERCLDCGHLVRGVEPAEVKAAMLSVQLLDADPWEAAP